MSSNSDLVREALTALFINRDVSALDKYWASDYKQHNPASITAALDGIRNEMGAVDALVHLVGAWKGGEPVHDMSLETWDRMMALNLR